MHPGEGRSGRGTARGAWQGEQWVHPPFYECASRARGAWELLQPLRVCHCCWS